MPNGYGPGHDRDRHPDDLDRGGQAEDSLPLSFVVCVSDDAVLETNLLASPCLASEVGAGSGHEVIAIREAPSAAAGLNQGLERARNELVVCVHQDVHLSPGPDRIVGQAFQPDAATAGRIGPDRIVGQAFQPDAAAAGPVGTDRVRLESLTYDGFGTDRVRLESLTYDGFGTDRVRLESLTYDGVGTDRVRLESLTYDGVGTDRVRLESLTYDGAGPGLASIIVPCWNQVEFTRLCLDALFRHTRRPWELIVVDNGSTDGTAEFLAGIPADGRATATVPVSVTVIRNEQNRGFPAAVNQGLRAARGEFLVLLNNDAVVTEGWLDHLIALTAVEVEAGEDKGRVLTAKNAKDAKDGGGVVEAAASRRIGLVGPMSNYVAPPQLVDGVAYRDLDEMHAFAARWQAEQRGKWFTTGKLSGFCLLMTRDVFDAIGGLDERFGLGFFDDDDLAERARRAGFALGVAMDVFVHHFGSRSFVGNGVDAGRVLEENAGRFAEKWGLAGLAGRRVALTPWASGGGGYVEGGGLPRGKRGQAPGPGDAGVVADGVAAGSQSPFSFASTLGESGGGAGCSRPARRSARQGSSTGPSGILARRAGPVGQDCPTYGDAAVMTQRPCRVSLTMIVRDEEKNLANCLGSVRGVFDEIIVVDTGSVDRTVEIARSFGARVFDFVWVDDFAAARNAALARATGDYAFWLDADDVVEPVEREKLVALLAGLGSPAAYVVRCACDPGEDGSGGETVVDHIRLFPLGQAIRWTYRVHEQILPALRRVGVPVKWSGVTVRHTGYSNRAVRSRKLARDSRILAGELEERPGDPFVLFNLGAIAIERQAWREALEYLRRSLAGSAPGDSITRKLYALIARSHQMLGEPGEALAACAAGLEVDPDDAELMFREAIVRRQTGDAEGARKCWERILTLSRPEKFASVDQGIYGHLTRRNLAALAAERGDREEEERLWRAVLAECPGDREAQVKIAGLAAECVKFRGEPAT